MIKTYKDLESEYKETGNPLFDKIIKNQLSQVSLFEKRKKNSLLQKLHIYTDLPSGQISFSVLSSVTGGFQNILTGAINHYCGGSNDGKVSKVIKEQSQLSLIDVAPGSFIVKFAPTNEFDIDDSQKSLFDNYSSKINVSDTLDRLVDDISSLSKSQDNIEKFQKNFGRRTFLNTNKWIKKLNEDQVELDFINKDSKVIKFHREEITSLEKNISNYTSNKTSNSFTTFIPGFLVQVNIDTGVLVLKSGNGLKQYKIKINDDSLRKLNITTNKRYIIEAKKEVNYHENNKTELTSSRLEKNLRKL